MTDAALDKAMESTNANVTLRGRKEGTATITITATDADGLMMSWPIEVTVVPSANTVPIVDPGVTFPGTGVGANDTYAEFVKISDIGRFKSTDTMPKRLELDLGSIFNDPDVETTARTGDSWTFKAMSTDTDVVTVGLESIGTRAKPDLYNVVITPVGPGNANIYFTVTDSFDKSIGGETPDDTDADGTLIANTFFAVKVNNKPVPYSGEGDARKSLSTEDEYQGLVADFDTTTSATLIDDPATDASEGYFSDKDDDPLLCRLMSTTGDSATINIATRSAFTLDGAEGKTGTSTFTIRCFDRVGATGSQVDFEWAEDTLTVTVPYLQSIQ